MLARQRHWRLLGALALALAAIGAVQLGSAGYLHAKALFGQWLLARAWQEAQLTGVPVRPWPWADLHPIARLQAPAHAVQMLVLEGANGRTLAWGPGHLESSPAPGAPGNAIVTGHRDTHFAFLRALAHGDMLIIETTSGSALAYRVRETRIVDHRLLRLPDGKGEQLLTLVTCYPFDAIDPGTPLRYVVVAEAQQALSFRLSEKTSR